MKNLVYEGKDLEAMSLALNYNDWIFSYFDKYVGKKILEVGAGNGNITNFLIQRYRIPIVATEPSNMFEILKVNSKNFLENGDLKIYKNVIGDIIKILGEEKVDTILYNNVLEHIKDDSKELEQAYQILPKDGYLLNFTPAMQGLYSDWDKKLGHHQRYSLKEMTQKMRKAGFKIEIAIYFDFIGMILWYLKYKVIKSQSISSANVFFFDKIVVPISKVFDLSKVIPAGKNVLIVGKKV